MFKNQIETSIKISSTANKIWKELTNFDEYKNWNPSIIDISGELGKNKTIKIVVKIDEKTMIFKPIVLECEENKELRWLGKLLFNGIFDGEHYFLIKENIDETYTFIQGERFSGILIPFFGKMILKTKKGFEAMNQELKKRVERV
ncbi:SRPBCC domain-containing protein [Aliarcobacter butzleri]|uniref:Polyketide cyclase n=2 Tax=Aliarcobacter butzleri TaxID=28197 RepID=A0A837J6G8_9BACT|nr:SRPBCC domain-containing protein [Aliarcobacter butzleri]KLD97378.1 polyketide cyclase [Aliarcobacter butzleri L349]KLE01398.1 polyketide cyclase [Aliarcobacter butzleri L351]KLE13151.1 polyketide cyclase [Aliarcobacter butzleri L350]MCG3670187.1 SRPBCC domain-containing protein [Aliarcobacter butzleri]MDH1976002.1 SRPBCC domain-containing protein [Aliarcobacter butzleri]